MARKQVSLQQSETMPSGISIRSKQNWKNSLEGRSPDICSSLEKSAEKTLAERFFSYEMHYSLEMAIRHHASRLVM
ncbi:MAG: hypothetical protein VKL39_05105 [Leptolyngbyaceae bacterium]|nr:hypothetical protein [Leptolyngbyaceae bacterium]